MQAVSEKAITYIDEFKRHFISENEMGKLPREIFEEAGLNIELIGVERAKAAGKRWRAAFRKAGVEGLQDTRKTNFICPIRKANPARRMAKATKEHRTCGNKLNRNFKQGVVGTVLLTNRYHVFNLQKR